MIYFLYGDDTNKARAKLKSLLKVLFAKKPDASFFKFDVDNFNQAELDNLTQGQGLFEKKYIVQMDGLLGDKDNEVFLLAKLKQLQSSDNIFIFIEGKIKKTVLNKIFKFANKVQAFSGGIKGKRDFITEKGSFNLGNFNIFDLATCFGQRDKKKLWILLQETQRRDIPAEEVSGIIFWQLKTMFQTLNSPDASKANLNPFVFNKAKSYLKKYSENEMKKISSQLVFLYHNARRDGLELNLALEKFILEL